MTDEDVRVSHIVPADDRDAAQENTERGEISDAIRYVYRAFADGEAYPGIGRDAAERAALQTRIDRLDEYESSVAEIREDMTEYVATLEERKEERIAARDEYEDRLRSLEADLRDGAHVDPEHGKVRDAAKSCGRSPTEVVEELKQRNPDVPDHAFRPWSETQKDWNGISS